MDDQFQISGDMHPPTVQVVSTCNASQWSLYGRQMAESFIEYWPTDAQLTVYGDVYFTGPRGVNWHPMPVWFSDWKNDHLGDREACGMQGKKYNFRRDCVRFAHKIAALTDIAKNCRAEILIMIDIDTVTDRHIDLGKLRSWLPEISQMAWLDRDNMYPECGFVMFRPSHPAIRDLMRRLEACYMTGRVFDFKETHDSYVIQQLVEVMVLKGEMSRPYSLSGPYRKMHHPFVFSELGDYMDHLKGGRKAIGASPERRKRCTQEKGS